MAERLNEAGETWDDDHGLDPRAAQPVERCVKCGHEIGVDSEGLCNQRLDHLGDVQPNLCPCRCVFTSETESETGDKLRDEAPTLEDLAIQAADYLENTGERHAGYIASALRQNMADTRARVSPVADARQVREIQERVADNFRELGADEWRHQYTRDVKTLLALLGKGDEK